MRIRNPTFVDDLLRPVVGIGIPDEHDWTIIRGISLPDNTDDPEEREIVHHLNKLRQTIED